MRSKAIELYDSMGKRQSNDHYLEHTMRYIYGTLFKHAGEDKPAFAYWSQDWSASDESDRSPLQDNGYDCGMFTLISMGLLRNGHRLNRSSYRQSTLRMRLSRRKLAWTIWKAGLEDEDIRWQPQEQAPTTKASEASPTTGAGVAGRQRLKRGRQENRVVCAGGPKIQAFFRPAKRKKEDAGRGRKRSARSESEEEGERGLMRRYLMPPRKRTRPPEVGP